MKKIKLSEEQLRLFEKLIKEEDAPNFDGGTVKDFDDSSENGIAPVNTTDTHGNTKHGQAVKQLDAPEKMCPQNWWANGMTGWRRMP